MKTIKRKGFTLAELLVVVAILALIGTLALMQIDGVEEQATEKVTVANQGNTLKCIQTYCAMNKGKFNHVDSLLRVDVPKKKAGTLVFVETDKPNVKTTNGFYNGVTQVGSTELTDRADSQTLAKAQRCKGVYNDDGWNGSPYAIYYGGFWTMRGLNRLGLTQIYDHSYGYGFPGEADKGREKYAANYGQMDNPDEVISGGPAFRVDSSAIWPRKLTYDRKAGDGQPMVIINPRDQKTYKHFGINIKKFTTKPTEEECAKALSDAKYLLAVFGLGNSSSIVGARGGINNAPKCNTLGKEFYPFYLVVVKISLSPNDLGAAKVVGILDSKGRTTKGVQFSNTWRHGD